jgi:NADP-dependent alcohol dehydrogenase
MKPFVYRNPTVLHFGRGAAAALKEEIAPGTRVFVLYGRGSAKACGACGDVRRALSHCTVHEFWGVEPNPQTATLARALEEARAFGTQFLLAVGGGSALDGGKLLACALAEKAPRGLWDIVVTRRPCGMIPFGGVVTLPATGSEMNRSAVISHAETKEKRSFDTPLWPRFAIVDPAYARTLSPKQLAPALADIAAHVLEQYLTKTGQSRTMDRWAEGLLLTLRETAPALIGGRASERDLEDYALAAVLALNDMIAMGVEQDWSAHAIGHEITALTGLAHGSTLAIVYPALCRALFEEKKGKLAQMGARVFGIGEPGEEKRARLAADALEGFFASLGLPTRLDEAGAPEDIDGIICRRFAERGLALGENRSVDAEAVRRILALARPAKA